MEAFQPPANLDDLDAPRRAAWSRFISGLVDDAAKGPVDDPNDSPRDQFYNPLKTQRAADAVEKAVTWSGFPKRITLSTTPGPARWRAADRSRDVQDEYCEWSVERDMHGKVKRVTFTCEGPEYWQFLANTDPEQALALYRQHVSPSVQRADILTSDNIYITRNRWNTSTSSGVMHLVQRSNTLGAEIELAAAATVLREHDGQLLTSEQELIECSRYGDPGRNSDPHIGGEVNALARAKASVTLADPVGLYMDKLSTAGWETPDGTDPASFWRVTRGSTAFAVRGVYDTTGHDYLVGDITINGKPIQFGSQIAEFITMRLTGLAQNFNKSAGKARPCLGRGVTALAATAVRAAQYDVHAFLHERPTKRREA